MLANVLALGFIIFFGFWFLYLKLSLITRLRLLGHPFLLDAGLSLAIFLMFGASALGLLAASFAALVLSISISMARRYFGYMKGSRYYLGIINLHEKVRAQYRSEP